MRETEDLGAIVEFRSAVRLEAAFGDFPRDFHRLLHRGNLQRLVEILPHRNARCRRVFGREKIPARNPRPREHRARGVHIKRQLEIHPFAVAFNVRLFDEIVVDFVGCLVVEHRDFPRAVRFAHVDSVDSSAERKAALVERELPLGLGNPPPLRPALRLHLRHIKKPAAQILELQPNLRARRLAEHRAGEPPERLRKVLEDFRRVRRIGYVRLCEFFENPVEKSPELRRVHLLPARVVIARLQNVLEVKEPRRRLEKPERARRQHARKAADGRAVFPRRDKMRRRQTRLRVRKKQVYAGGQIALRQQQRRRRKRVGNRIRLRNYYRNPPPDRRMTARKPAEHIGVARAPVVLVAQSDGIADGVV